MKRILPPSLLLISIILMAALHFLIPLYSIIEFPANIFGLIPLIGGLFLAAKGSNKFKMIGTTVMTFDEPSILVVDGLFKYSRNPMYLGFALMIAGIWILMGSLSPLMIALAFITITDFHYIRYEEKVMEKIFRERYLDYKKRVRRWI